jgi:hypothetical protein
VARAAGRVKPGRHVTEQVELKRFVPQPPTLALAMAPRALHWTLEQLMLPAQTPEALQVNTDDGWLRVKPGRHDTVHASLKIPAPQVGVLALAIAPKGLHGTGWQMREPAQMPEALQVYVDEIWLRVKPGRHATVQVSPKTPEPQVGVLALAMAPREPHCTGWQSTEPAQTPEALQVNTDDD